MERQTWEKFREGWGLKSTQCMRRGHAEGGIMTVACPAREKAIRGMSLLCPVLSCRLPAHLLSGYSCH